METDSLKNEDKNGETMSTIHLKRKKEISLRGDFFDIHDFITFIPSIKSLWKKDKSILQSTFFSTCFNDEGGILFVRVLATSEKISLKVSEIVKLSEVVSLIKFNYSFGR